MDAKELGEMPFNTISLRQYFAGVAMQGLCAQFGGSPRWHGQSNAEVCAEHAAQFADALLAELAKDPA